MPLPPEVALRRVAGRVFYDDGEPVSGGRITFTMPGPVHYRAPSSSALVYPSRVLLPTTHAATVDDDGYFELGEGLIPWDDPNIDAGTNGQPWAYEVRRTWGIRTQVASVLVTRGATGTTADEPLDLTNLIVPTPPTGVAVVRDGLNEAAVLELIAASGGGGGGGGGSIGVDTDGTPYLIAPGGGVALDTDGVPYLIGA